LEAGQLTNGGNPGVKTFAKLCILPGARGFLARNLYVQRWPFVRGGNKIQKGQKAGREKSPRKTGNQSIGQANWSD